MPAYGTFSGFGFREIHKEEMRQQKEYGQAHILPDPIGSAIRKPTITPIPSPLLNSNILNLRGVGDVSIGNPVKPYSSQLPNLKEWNFDSFHSLYNLQNPPNPILDNNQMDFHIQNYGWGMNEEE